MSPERRFLRQPETPPSVWARGPYSKSEVLLSFLFCAAIVAVLTLL